MEVVGGIDIVLVSCIESVLPEGRPAGSLWASS